MARNADFKSVGVLRRRGSIPPYLRLFFMFLLAPKQTQQVHARRSSCRDRCTQLPRPAFQSFTPYRGSCCAVIEPYVFARSALTRCIFFSDGMRMRPGIREKITKPPLKNILVSITCTSIIMRQVFYEPLGRACNEL